MELSDVEKSFKFLSKLILEKGLGGTREFVTVQYIGGEISTLPSDYVKRFVEIAESSISPLFHGFKHGVQSNLVSSKAKLDFLIDAFDGNVGTSYDDKTGQRTVNGDPAKYRVVFMKNVSHAKKTIGKAPAGIIVVDRKMLPFLAEEIAEAEARKSDLTLRPAFQGGSPVDSLDSADLSQSLSSAYSKWIMRSPISIEPFHSLLRKRALRLSGIADESPWCPFQSDCAINSLDLEPNGDLYVCQDMADSGRFRLGNALIGEFDDDAFSLLKGRTANLSEDCLSCRYLNECRGGCMNEALEGGAGPYGKTPYCSVWKSLFFLMDETVRQYGSETVLDWLNRLEGIPK